MAVEARPVVEVVYVLRFVVGSRLAAASVDGRWPDLFAVASWWLTVVAVYVCNGVMDFDEDVANGSSRPIARGRLPRFVAATFAAGAAVLAIAGSLATAHAMTVWIIAFLLLGWAYSSPPWPTKRRSLSSSVTVFGLGWCTYAAGISAADGRNSVSALVFALVGSAWMAGVGTLLKDLSDVPGDATAGRRTIAVRLGVQRAHAVARAGALVVAIAGVVASTLWAPRTLAGTGVFLLGAVLLAQRSPLLRSTDRHTQRGPYRMFMYTQYAANLAILLALA